MKVKLHLTGTVRLEAIAGSYIPDIVLGKAIEIEAEPAKLMETLVETLEPAYFNALHEHSTQLRERAMKTAKEARIDEEVANHFREFLGDWRDLIDEENDDAEAEF